MSSLNSPNGHILSVHAHLTRGDASESAASVLRRFRQVFNAVKTHFQQVEKMTGLGGAQLWALSIIRERPGLSVNDLAAAMDIHQSTASNLVRSLVSRDMVLAEKTGHDRRQVHLKVRPVGLTLLDRAPGPLTGVLPQALASLDDLTLQRLDADLAKLISVLDGDDSGARVPLGD